MAELNQQKTVPAVAASTARPESLGGFLVTAATNSLGHSMVQEATVASWASRWQPGGPASVWSSAGALVLEHLCWMQRLDLSTVSPVSLFPHWSDTGAPHDMCLGLPVLCCSAGDPHESIFTGQEPSRCPPELFLLLSLIRLLLSANWSCRETRTATSWRTVLLEMSFHIVLISFSVCAFLTASCSRHRTIRQ